MLARIDEKIEAGFRCIKLKIGGIRFDEELNLINHIRERYAPEELELRLDANGSFTPSDALCNLRALAPYAHTLDRATYKRPDRLRPWLRYVRKSPIPVALDEELIGCRDTKSKIALLDNIKPQYIILKPSLCGGFAASEEWAALALRAWHRMVGYVGSRE